jgi:hypothetical protein
MVDFSEAQIIEPFHRELRKAIVETCDMHIKGLVAGVAKDYADYKEQVGYITALTQVLEMCADIEKERYRSRSFSDKTVD